MLILTSFLMQQNNRWLNVSPPLSWAPTVSHETPAHARLPEHLNCHPHPTPALCNPRLDSVWMCVHASLVCVKPTGVSGKHERAPCDIDNGCSQARHWAAIFALMKSLPSLLPPVMCRLLCAAWATVAEPATRSQVHACEEPACVLIDPSATRALAFKFEIHLCSSFSLQPCIILHWLDSLPCTSAPHQKHPAQQGFVSVEHTDLSLTPCWRSTQSRGIGRSLLK